MKQTDLRYIGRIENIRYQLMKMLDEYLGKKLTRIPVKQEHLMYSQPKAIKTKFFVALQKHFSVDYSKHDPFL